jgi:hypothetical protein
VPFYSDPIYFFHLFKKGAPRSAFFVAAANAAG